MVAPVSPSGWIACATVLIFGVSYRRVAEFGSRAGEWERRPTCRVLVSELSESDLPKAIRERLLCIFPDRQVDDSRTASLANKIKLSMFSCVFDEGNRLHAAAGIYGTPSALLMTRDKGLDFKAGVNLEWMRDRVVRPVLTGAPAT